MKVFNQNQYNQGIGKYKLLSSTSGVGSIITTKFGTYILISDIMKWKFVEWANARIEFLRTDESDLSIVYDRSKKEILNRGLNFVDDKRFVIFLKKEKSLENLVCLIGIPHMSLNESFNTPNWKNHPVKHALDKNGETGFVNDYLIMGTHFPKWFKNSKNELKKIGEWMDIWQTECRRHNGILTTQHFAPPRDGTHFIREHQSKNAEGTIIKIREYKPLSQTNLILICPNGHLSDIPWAKYIYWKSNINDDKNAEKLLTYPDCCSKPRLVWTESKTKSEGYASIFIHCECCGTGKNSKINLEGINGISPFCLGEKPWESSISLNETRVPTELCFKRNEESNGRESMKVALVTANNVYYASGFSSLFIPMNLAEDKPVELTNALTICETKYALTLGKAYEKSKVDWFDQKVDAEFLENDCGIDLGKISIPYADFLKILQDNFLNSQVIINGDFHEYYRFQEFRCFSGNNIISIPGLKFKDIELGENLSKFFKKIQQVEELRITNVQLDFNRVKPKERIVVDGIPQVRSEGKNIFSTEPSNTYVLPANESLGEGIFIQFDQEKIDNWLSKFSTILQTRYSSFYNNPPEANSQGAGVKRKIFNNGIKHFLIHSFSHLLMRELEFSCGYPTASLKERLYISNNTDMKMSGVLIYTAEGAEGSMGGLVSQGEPQRILEIINNGLSRMNDCSSDPLCWESDGQGIFNLNLAACFSCSLVSETACEEMNLGLDRRVLIDDDFGYFKELI